MISSIAIVGVFSIAWVGIRGLLAKQELEEAISLASSFQTQVESGDTDAVAQTARQLRDRSSSAHSLTSDLVWRSLELVPWAGANLTAVRELSAVVDSISEDAVMPLAGAAASIDISTFKLVDGAVDLEPMIAAQSQVKAATTALADAQADAAKIDTTKTVEIVSEAAQQLNVALSKTVPALDALNRTVQLVPAMLGAEGTRNYILMFQNPAELRATGGIAGALAVLHTDNGTVQLTQQASSATVPQFDEPVLPLSVETQSLYGNITGQFIQDVNLTPNFPISGALAAEMWRLGFGTEVDGVISLDPVALSYILKATGPITLPTGDVLAAENAVELLLTDVYARYEVSADQDKFFASAATSVFTAVAGGTADPIELIRALVRAGDEDRVLIYSAHEDEQDVLAATTVAGGLPSSTDDQKTFGIYFNDAGGTKMGTFLKVSTAVGQATCRVDKRPEFAVDVTLTNTAPSDAATSLSRYVTGGGMFGVSPGNIKTIVNTYGAPDLQNLGVARDGADVPALSTTDATYQVSSISVELAPGESTVLRFRWLASEPFGGSLNVRVTPTVNPILNDDLTLTC